MTFALVEQIALEAVSVNTDGSRRVRLLSPGQGSSGFYSAEVISGYIAEALPKGSLVYLDHTSESDVIEREGTRSIKDIAGKFLSDPVYEATAAEGAGSYANIKFTRGVEPLIEDVGDAIAVSIEIYKGKKDAKGNITEMGYHPLNSLAIVPVGGRDGRIFESFRASALEGHDNGGMDMPISEEDRKAIVTDVLAAFTEAQKLAPKEEEAPVEIDHAALVVEVIKAELPTDVVPLVVEAVKGGKSVEDAIKEQAVFVEAIRGKKDDAENVLSEGLRKEQAKEQDIKNMKPAERGNAYVERFFSKKGGNA